jgi:hypothetical protein
MGADCLLERYRRGPAARRARADARNSALDALLCRWRAAVVLPDLSAKSGLWWRLREELRSLDWRLVVTRAVRPGARPEDYADKEITLPALRRSYLAWRGLQSAKDSSSQGAETALGDIVLPAPPGTE